LGQYGDKLFETKKYKEASLKYVEAIKQNPSESAFYQNAGSTKREGIELLLQHQFSHRLSANLTFNSASFTYKNFEQNGENYAGNKLPGIPKNFGVLRLTYQWKNGPLINYSKTYRSDLYADNNNATRVDSFYRDDINLSIPLNKINDRTAVFLGCNNLFNSLYSDNIRINAFGGRYYEAAPEREIYVNLQWQF